MYRATLGRRQFCGEIGERLGQIVTASKTRPKGKRKDELSMVSPELPQCPALYYNDTRESKFTDVWTGEMESEEITVEVK